MLSINGTLLDACVLGILDIEDTYGYQVTQKLKRHVTISESTLYPVLRRLQKENYVKSYDVSYEGRNRRYYKITDTGKIELQKARDSWKNHQKVIELFLNKGGIESNE